MRKKGILLFLVVLMTLLFTAMAYSECTQTVVLLTDYTLIKKIPDDKPPVNVTEENQVCYVKKGTNACIIEEKSYPEFMLLYLKVETLDGDCVGRTGWLNAKNVKKK